MKTAQEYLNGEIKYDERGDASVSYFTAKQAIAEAQKEAWNECIDRVELFIDDWYENERAFEGKDFWEELKLMKK